MVTGLTPGLGVIKTDMEIQSRVRRLWSQVTNDNIDELTDLAGYKSEFLRLFGF